MRASACVSKSTPQPPPFPYPISIRRYLQNKNKTKKKVLFRGFNRVRENKRKWPVPLDPVLGGCERGEDNPLLTHTTRQPPEALPQRGVFRCQSPNKAVCEGIKSPSLRPPLFHSCSPSFFALSLHFASIQPTNQPTNDPAPPSPLLKFKQFIDMTSDPSPPSD